MPGRGCPTAATAHWSSRRAPSRGHHEPYSPECVEGFSMLKKSSVLPSELGSRVQRHGFAASWQCFPSVYILLGLSVAGTATFSTRWAALPIFWTHTARFTEVGLVGDSRHDRSSLERLERLPPKVLRPMHLPGLPSCGLSLDAAWP